MRWPSSSREPRQPGPSLVVSTSEAEFGLVAELSGTLDLTTAPRAGATLRKLLLDRGRVLVDAARLAVGHEAVLAVFPTELAAVGGWPEARMVVVAPPGDLAAGMRRSGCDREVPVAPDRASGVVLLERRPARVRRTVALPRDAGPPVAVARALCASACSDWAVPVGEVARVVTVTEALVGNAVEHTDGPVDMRIVLDGAGLRVSVADRRPDLRPRRDEVVPFSGLQLVEDLSDGWGFVTRRYDKTVWATFRAAGGRG